MLRCVAMQGARDSYEGTSCELSMKQEVSTSSSNIITEVWKGMLVNCYGRPLVSFDHVNFYMY